MALRTLRGILSSCRSGGFGIVLSTGAFQYLHLWVRHRVGLDSLPIITLVGVGTLRKGFSMPFYLMRSAKT